MQDEDVRLVRTAMTFHNLTNWDMADRGNTHSTTVSNVLQQRRKPPIDLAIALTELLQETYPIVWNEEKVEA